MTARIKKGDIRYQALLAMGDLIANGDKNVTEAVTLACEDPKSYGIQFAQTLDDRNINSTHKNLPWIALVDVLIRKKKIVEIDWKTSLEDLTGSLHKLTSLSKTVKQWDWISKYQDIEARDTLELLEIIGEHFSVNHDLALVQFDIESDSYPLLATPKEKVKYLVTLAKKAKYGNILIFTGKNLKKYEAARRVKQSKAIAKESLNPDRQHQFSHPDGRLRTIEQRQWWRKDILNFEIDAVLYSPGINKPKKEKFIFQKRGERQRARAHLLKQYTLEGFRKVSLQAFLKLKRALKNSKK